MKDLGSDFDETPISRIAFPSIDIRNQDETLAIRNSGPIGKTKIKVIAPQNVKAGDSYRINGGWSLESNAFYNGPLEFFAYEAGTKNVLAKIKAVGRNDGKGRPIIDYLEVTWTAYAASRQNVWIEMQVGQAFEFFSDRGDPVKPGFKKTVRYGLTGCDGAKTKVINKPITTIQMDSWIRAFDFDQDDQGKVAENNRVTFFTRRAGDYGIKTPNEIMRVYVNLGKGWNFKCSDLPGENLAGYGYYIEDKDILHHAQTQQTPSKTVQPGSRKVRAYCDYSNPKRAFFELGIGSVEDRLYANIQIYPDGSKVSELVKKDGKPSIEISAEIHKVPTGKPSREVGALGPRWNYLKNNPTTGGAELPPGKLKIVKKGNGLTPGHTFLTGTPADFTYEVTNIGERDVNSIAVIDSKGVKVTCPKAELRPGESMTCTGRGVVK